MSPAYDGAKSIESSFAKYFLVGNGMFLSTMFLYFVFSIPNTFYTRPPSLIAQSRQPTLAMPSRNPHKQQSSAQQMPLPMKGKRYEQMEIKPQLMLQSIRRALSQNEMQLGIPIAQPMQEMQADVECTRVMPRHSIQVNPLHMQFQQMPEMRYEPRPEYVYQCEMLPIVQTQHPALELQMNRATRILFDGLNLNEEYPYEVAYPVNILYDEQVDSPPTSTPYISNLPSMHRAQFQFQQPPPTPQSFLSEWRHTTPTGLRSPVQTQSNIRFT